jgi:hypothetical protein
VKILIRVVLANQVLLLVYLLLTLQLINVVMDGANFLYYFWLLLDQAPQHLIRVCLRSIKLRLNILNIKSSW